MNKPGHVLGAGGLSNRHTGTHWTSRPTFVGKK